MTAPEQGCAECCVMCDLRERVGLDGAWRIIGSLQQAVEAEADALGIAPASLAQLLADTFAHEAEAADEDMADDLASVEAKAAEVERVAAKIKVAVEAPATKARKARA